jgi:hypothetical protein
MKTSFLSLTAFLLFLIAGRLLVSGFVDGTNSNSANKPIAPRGADSRRSGVQACVAAVSPRLSDQIKWERQMWLLEPERFAKAFETECGTALDSDRPFRLLAIWAQRDPDGLIAWGRVQPDSMFMPLAGHSIGIGHALVSAATRQDPEEAWRLAAAISANNHSVDTNRGFIIGILFGIDPAAARDFVRKHRDEIAAFGQGNIGWHGLEPQEALPVAMELPAGLVRTSIVAEMARFYLERSDASAAARQWFESLPPEHQNEVSKLPGGKLFTPVPEAHLQKLNDAWPAPASE